MTDLITFSFPDFDFWEIFLYLLSGLLKIGAVILVVFFMWGIAYLIFKKWFPKYHEAFIHWSRFVVVEQIYNSELSESFRGLVGSIYDAISSILRTFSSILNISFTGLTSLIEYPFGYLQRFFDKINDSVVEKTHKHKINMEENRIRRRHERLERRVQRDQSKKDFQKRMKEIQEGKGKTLLLRKTNGD